MKDLYRIAAAAERCRIKRTTLIAAADRGELDLTATGCGLRLVKLAEVRKWAKQPRKPGRKPASRNGGEP